MRCQCNTVRTRFLFYLVVALPRNEIITSNMRDLRGKESRLMSLGTTSFSARPLHLHPASFHEVKHSPLLLRGKRNVDKRYIQIANRIYVIYPYNRMNCQRALTLNAHQLLSRSFVLSFVGRDRSKSIEIDRNRRDGDRAGGFAGKLRVHWQALNRSELNK